MGPEPTTSKVKAFGGGKFPGFFWHEFELLRRMKEAKREREEGKTTKTKTYEYPHRGKRERRASEKG